MRFSVVLGLSLALVQGSTIPQRVAPQPDCKSQCTTHLGYTSKKNVPTYSHTKTKTTTRTTTKHVKSTVTVSPTSTTTVQTATSTVTTTSTGVASTGTATVTVTTSVQSTITLPPVSITETDTTSTVTTTTTTTTSTVSAPIGFVPIQTSLPGSTGSMRKRYVARMQARAKLENRGLPQSDCRRLNKPQSVDCYTTKTVTKTVTKTKTDTPCTVTGTVSTITSTKTTTTTTTSTVFPPSVTSTITVSTTTTDLSTITPTVTVTTTTTNTLTDTATSTATYYAQCAPNNIATAYLGQPLAAVGVVSETSSGFAAAQVDGGNTAYDCCVAGVANPPGGDPGTVGFMTFDIGGCAIYYYSNCPAGQPSNIYYVTGQGASGTASVMNGACGEINAYQFAI